MEEMDNYRFTRYQSEKLNDIIVELADWSSRVNTANGFKALSGGSTIDQIACIGLIHTELSEMVEKIRKSPDKDVVSDTLQEAADVFIRLLDFVDNYDVDGTAAFVNHVIENIKKNELRGFKHGGRRA